MLRCRDIAVLTLLFFITACSNVGPSESELEKKFETRIGDNWTLEDFSAEDPVNKGTEEAPRFETAFTAILEAKESTYRRARPDFNRPYDGSVTMVSLTHEEGDEAEYTGIAYSTLHDGKWTTRISGTNAFSAHNGDLLSSFRNPIIKGSSQEKEYLQARYKASITLFKKVLASGKTYDGAFIRNDYSVLPLTMTFNNFSSESGQFKGVMSIMDGRLLVKVDGRLTEDKFILKETEIVNASNRPHSKETPDTEYVLKREKSILSDVEYELSGDALGPNGEIRGILKIHIK